jgi:hypothetical protein
MGVIVKYKKKGPTMTKKNIKITGVLLGVTALGAFAFTAAPVFAANDGTQAWHEVEVATTSELALTGSVSTEVKLAPTTTGSADSKAAGPLGVRANVAWKVQWIPVGGLYTAESTTPVPYTYLTATGFSTVVANAALTYQGTNAVASGSNVWSAQLASTGTGQTLSFVALPSTNTPVTILSGTSTADTELTATYSADIDATLNAGTYYGTIYYKLSTN